MNLKHFLNGGVIPTAFAVLIDETTFVFEPDEEGGYRALLDTEKVPVNDKSTLIFCR